MNLQWQALWQHILFVYNLPSLLNFIGGNCAWLQDPCLSMQPRHSCRALLHVILTTVTLCSVASQTVCSCAYSLCRTRHSSTWPHHTRVETTPLASGPTTSWFQAGPPGLQGAARCKCSISCRRLPACLSRRPSPATIGRHRHVLRSTDQHTARRSELRSRWTTALEQSESASQDSPARQRHRRISSAAEVVFV